MFLRDKARIIINRTDNRQQIIVGFIRNHGCAENLFRANIVVRSWQVDDEISREQIVIRQRNEDIGKRSGCIADIC